MLLFDLCVVLQEIIRAARFCIRRTLSSISLLHEVHTGLAYIIRGLITAALK